MARVDYFHDPHAPKANSLRPAVSAFVQDDAGRLLMIRRTDNDKYAIPGGQQEVGETLTQATIREVMEETGVAVEVTDLIGLYSNPEHVIEYDDGEVRQEFSICFRARPLGGDLRTSSESKEVQWVSLNEIDRLDIHPSIRLRINHALAETTTPYFT
ncbi:ADP-ribose pyrophosphatase YjhB, NUDIX family [Lentzea xinjiangensis]|uniref:ADP-ribose pyrophosphatase YjhB, NUDIX family n=1 Tax=Lentzea xinjiangensis TaxID=402600 RepID=A0A1H9AVC0_9PSEU|nr:NUDIX domain-containing protein [Lentzea xinjiangensis]SEP80441.1 ADP-ribose pyrophosphatase YjhB, NUDIX family [Lentzea xinjiangensis]